MDLLATVRIFTRVVERGSMSGAARELEMGQPAVSERIHKLETFLGAKLLMRSARTLTCTDEGQLFYDCGRELLAAADRAITAVSSKKEAVAGAVRLASAQCFGEVVLPHVLMRVREQYPKLHLDLVLNDAVVDPVTEGVDISIRLGQLGEGGYVAHPLGYVHRTLVAAPAYLARHGQLESPADIRKHDFIRVKGIFGNELLPLVRANGPVENFPISTILVISHWRPMFEMISAGAGIGVVQQPACLPALRQGKLVELLPQYRVPSFPINVLVQATRPMPPRIRAIIDILKSEVPFVLRQGEGSHD
ncbi:LysR family transcriptional regulator [Achromobacter pestifer]|uniref:HTH-type transcriptional regulator DmlR n=1 Tax=Achromobacter pestifer TaxID=1353889 RepID=A0A6S6Z9X6_9BURK|nr:LysR family transcriptional regulator [Achromobacter pestifer]CAB3669791.1 HTH-type transcriptional regulator DmlR [Achromobacter pestifer]